MNKMKQWISRLNVRQKLIFYGYLTITPALILLSAVLLIYFYNNQKAQELENSIENVNALYDGLLVMQTDIKDITTYIAINNDVRKLLNAENVEEKNLNARVWEDEAPMDFIQDMIALKGHVKTFAIYSERGIRPFLRGMDGSVYLSNMEEVRDSEVYQKAVVSPNGMLWMDVGTGVGDVYSTSRTEKIVLARELYDIAKKERLGYIVMGIQKASFEELCQNIITSDNDGVLVLDSNGGKLCSVGTLEESLEEYLLSDEFVNSLKKNTSYVEYGNHIIAVAHSKENSGLIAMKIIPKYNFGMMARENLFLPITLFFGMFIGLMPLLLIISNMVTKPLKKLNRAIRLFSKGDFNQQVEVTTEDEIGEVSRVFNKMVLDIQDLINENYIINLKEKESEIAALQSQINPHFLYNTLDALYWKAMESDNEEMGECILALSQLFRMVLNQGEKDVTVAREIELVSTYLQIQEFRFSKHLDTEIRIAPEISKVMIPKLILQPFVENAVVHGFENGGEHCRLRITGEEVDGYLHFEIADTGIGMSKEQLEDIWNEDATEYRRQRIGHYAIKNIKERLYLRYRGNFKLEIESMEGVGTKVIIEVPREKDEWDA